MKTKRGLYFNSLLAIGLLSITLLSAGCAHRATHKAALREWNNKLELLKKEGGAIIAECKLLASASNRHDIKETAFLLTLTHEQLKNYDKWKDAMTQLLEKNEKAQYLLAYRELYNSFTANEQIEFLKICEEKMNLYKWASEIGQKWKEHNRRYEELQAELYAIYGYR